MGFGYVLSRCALLFFFLLSAVDAGSFASLQRYQDTDSYLRKPFLDQVTSDCTMEPNGTAFRPHFFSCNTIGKRRPFLVLNDAAVTNSTGDETFPVDFGQTVRFFFDVTSLSRKRRFDNMRVEIELYKRYSGWLGCGWIYIPTFRLLNRENLCEDNSSCPIRPGRQVVELAIEPSHMLSQALRMMIHDEAVPYQLAIRIKNRQRPAADLLCVNYLMRIRI
ncbi:hypothetical protein L596_014993 [Steinernema carpocapsae]|uniref:MD-2-related lipid-recognition domain-containing protein n=1 Tax=Steinernema carpocapsae TaxID=34508 RepID=A0A4U5NEG0_STECR|nr:hypothetical protein L596_014993 [Steinernema carpocapsae]